MKSDNSFAPFFWSVVAAVLIGISSGSVCAGLGIWLIIGILYERKD